MTIADRWWRVPYYKDKKLILMTGINAFLKSNEEGYIACIRTLYPEIEGIIRFSYLNENNKSANDTKELLNYITLKANNKFILPNSLTFPALIFR